jgi:hypothetical protein
MIAVAKAPLRQHQFMNEKGCYRHLSAFEDTSFLRVARHPPTILNCGFAKPTYGLVVENRLAHKFRDAHESELAATRVIAEVGGLEVLSSLVPNGGSAFARFDPERRRAGTRDQSQTRQFACLLEKQLPMIRREPSRCSLSHLVY